MIVKILRKSESFQGIGYNSRKIDQDTGELMLVSGFDALQGLDDPRPSDYINYLEAISAKSSRIKFPQFHVVISGKEDSYNKHQLTEIAANWMQGMGYGGQPYLVVAHKDTANVHVHIVSTRIDRDTGKKINADFERLKAYQVLNQLLAQDPVEQLTKETKEVLAYRISTKPQFAMLLEAKGYQTMMDKQYCHLYKFGSLQGKIPMADIEKRISAYQKDQKRIAQLRAILERYRRLHSGAVFPISSPLPGGVSGPACGYSSKLAEVLRQKFGLHILYHGAPGKPPYGFSILDHAQKTVLKGKEVMDIKEFITSAVVSEAEIESEDIVPLPEISTAKQEIVKPATGFFTSTTDWYTDKEHRATTTAEDNESAEAIIPAGHAESENTFLSALEDFRLDIADDVDDEQILGPTRRRKRKARTNTR